jgi:hypothetical protein
MRIALSVVLVLSVACNKKTQEPAPGSASVASGSAPAPAIDAAAAMAVDAAVAVDAAAAAGPLMIGKDGLSAIPRYKRTNKSDDDVTKDLAAKLAPFTVSFDVMEYADEREEGYFSVKQGETEVAQIFRIDDDGIDVRVLGAMIPTADGIRTGDKVSALAAKYSDLACEANKNDELGFLQCTSPKADGLVFVLNAEKYKGKQSGKLDVAKLADMPIFIIAAGVKK